MNAPARAAPSFAGVTYEAALASARALVPALRFHGLTVLMAEQNFHQAIRIADRGYIIVHGEIVFEGRTVAELETNPLVKNYYLGTG